MTIFLHTHYYTTIIIKNILFFIFRFFNIKRIFLGDTDRPLGKLPFYCEFQDKAGNNATLGPLDLQSWFSVNANPPQFKHVKIIKPINTFKPNQQIVAQAGDQIIVEMSTMR